MSQPTKPQIPLLPGHGYKCTCGETFTSIDDFRTHMITVGRGGGHKSAGKVDLKSGKSANKFYYKSGKGCAKLSVLEKFGISRPTANDETPPAPGEEDDPPEDDNPQEDQTDDPPTQVNPLDNSQPEDKIKKGKKDSPASRSTDNLAEATQIKFVPKVYTCTLTMTLLQTLDICYNVLQWPHDWPVERVLDKICKTFMEVHGIKLFQYEIDPQVLEALQARNNGAELEEVPQQ